MAGKHPADVFLTMRNFDRLIAAVEHASVGDAKMKALGAQLAELRAAARSWALLRLSVGNLTVAEMEQALIQHMDPGL